MTINISTSNLRLPIFQSVRAIVAFLVPLLLGFGLYGQAGFGKLYVEGTTGATHAVHGEGSGFWMMCGMTQAPAHMRFTRLDSVGEVIGSYQPVIAGWDGLTGLDLMYS